MEPDEILDRMQDKVRLAVTEGVTAALKEHYKESHDPLDAKVEHLQERVAFWRGAIWVVGGGLSLAVALMELKR